LITSDSQSFILSVEQSPKSSHFNDLIVVPLRDLRAQQMLLIDHPKPEKYALMVSLTEEKSQVLAVGQVHGPAFGRKFSDLKQLRLPGHTVQRFDVVESYNLVLAACFSESDESEEVPCLLLIDIQTTKILQKITYAPREYPSAVSWHTFDGIGEATPKLKVYVGSSLMADTQNGETESYSP